MNGAVAVLLAVLAAGPAVAQPFPASLQFPARPGAAVSPRPGSVRLAVPDDAPPFAWTLIDGDPGGYAVEVCRRVAEAIANGGPAAAPAAPLLVELVRVPVALQAAAVADGTVDLGCSAVPPAPGVGVAVSPPLAVSGVRMLAARLGPVSSWDDLAGGTVVVVANTAAEAVVRRRAGILSPPARVLAVPGPGDGYELLATGGADAFAADDLLLAGLLATRTDGPSFRVTGRALSQEAPVLLFRAGNPVLAAVVQRSVEQLRADGTLRARYDRWFTAPLPGGAALDRPASRETATLLGPPPAGRSRAGQD